MTLRKKKMIKVMLVILVSLVGELTVAQDSKSSHESFHLMKQRPKTRESSNFRPDTLATAVGFGKRTDYPYSIINNKQGHHRLSDIIALYPAQDITRRIPIYWLGRHVRRYIEPDQDIQDNAQINKEYPIVLSNLPRSGHLSILS